jgi:Prokaryotic E2 family E
VLSPITQRQFLRVQERHPGATLTELPSGAALFTLPNVRLPAGWSHPETTIRFIVPAGYPGPAPDCFWSDTALRVNGGALPQATQPSNVIPEANITAQWYSWHVTNAANNWNPNRDDLMTYLSIVLDRFRVLR